MKRDERKYYEGYVCAVCNQAVPYNNVIDELKCYLHLNCFKLRAKKYERYYFEVCQMDRLVDRYEYLSTIMGL